MNLINFYISIPFLVGIYLMMYQVSVFLLLIGTCFKNKVKSESYNLLYVLNTLAAWSSLFIVLAYVAEFFISWHDQNPYAWYAFKGEKTQIYWTWIFSINLLCFALGLLLFFRKLRIKRWFTLLFFLSSCGFVFERIVIYITSLYRDYLPSSWSAYYENWYPLYLYGFAVIILLLVVIYLWAKKKRRLPFPSVFLK